MITLRTITTHFIAIYLGYLLGTYILFFEHNAHSNLEPMPPIDKSFEVKNFRTTPKQQQPQQQKQQPQPVPKTETQLIPHTPINTPGWHPIHVYYGDTKHLKLPQKRFFSQAKQERHILELLKHNQPFNQKRNGYFVDLAANDAVVLSNTLTLEKDYAWNGLCIEPNPEYWYRLTFRKCHVAAVMVGKTMDQEVSVKFSNGVYGGIVGENFDNKMDEKKEVQKRYTATLQHVFEQFDVPKTIDYLSLDVEGAEEFIMKDFPFETYKFLTMTVERPNEALQKILRDNGYKFVKMVTEWGETLWAHEELVERNKIEISKEGPKWDWDKVYHED